MSASLNRHAALHGRTHGAPGQAETRRFDVSDRGNAEGHLADPSPLSDEAALAPALTARHAALDALINNAGGFTTLNLTTQGLDARFVVDATTLLAPAKTMSIPWLIRRDQQPGFCSTPDDR
jgi:NAD(P)-dependent dehydrogenase (short-subunit alcohol dehydrogenase family)